MQISPREAAEYLGITLVQLRNMMYEKQIPFTRISPRRSFFLVQQLDEWKAGWERIQPNTK